VLSCPELSLIISNMKRMIALLTSSVLLIGCATGPNAQTGLVLGGILGATAGGIIGHQKGRGLEGAALGAGIGALGGNAFGNGLDQQVYYNQRVMQQPQIQYISPPQIQERHYHHQRTVYICN
jgi:uncharacterized membrane protein YebE (DUF533 family)